MEGCISHSLEAGSDPFGIIQRMDNVLEAMPKELDGLQRDLENVRQQLETAKLEVAKPFGKEQELAEKSARLAELNSLLNMDKNEETDQPEHAGEPGEPETHQPDSPESDRKTGWNRGCMADSIICSRGKLQERFTDGFMLHRTAGSFRPAESGMP